MASLLEIEKTTKSLAQLTSKHTFKADEAEKKILTIRQHFDHLKGYSEEIEKLLLETKEWIENKGFHPTEHRHLAIEIINNMKCNAEFLATDAQTIKSSEILLNFERVFASGLVAKLEELSEDLEDMAENIEIGLNFDKELSELEPLLKKYSKVAKEVNLKKKLG